MGLFSISHLHHRHNKTPQLVQRAHGDHEEGTTKVRVLMLQKLRRRGRGCEVSESERPMRPLTARFQQVLTLSVGGSSTQLHWLAGEAARRYPTIGCDSAPFWIRVSGTFPADRISGFRKGSWALPRKAGLIFKFLKVFLGYNCVKTWLKEEWEIRGLRKSSFHRRERRAVP